MFSRFLRVKYFRKSFQLGSRIFFNLLNETFIFHDFKSDISEHGSSFISWRHFSNHNNFWEIFVLRKFPLLYILKHLSLGMGLSGVMACMVNG